MDATARLADHLWSQIARLPEEQVVMNTQPARPTDRRPPMTTYELPPEPPSGTRLVDKKGRTWTQERAGWWAASGVGVARWGGVLVHGPLTEAPTPTLPIEPGTVIRATGESDGERFEDVVLIRDHDGYWQGTAVTLSPIYYANDRIDTFTVLATHDPATQAVVPRKEYEALREAVGPGLVNREVIVAAHDLTDAVDGVA